MSAELTAWVMESPVSVTTTFNCSGADVSTNLSTFLPSFPCKGTGKRWAHSTRMSWSCFSTRRTSFSRIHSNSSCCKNIWEILIIRGELLCFNLMADWRLIRFRFIQPILHQSINYFLIKSQSIDKKMTFEFSQRTLAGFELILHW